MVVFAEGHFRALWYLNLPGSFTGMAMMCAALAPKEPQ